MPTFGIHRLGWLMVRTLNSSDKLRNMKARQKMSTFILHRLDWLMVIKRLPWNARYETVYRWFVSSIVIYTIMELKS